MTVPDGTLVPDAGVTLAVKVTLWPELIEVAEAVNTVVVATVPEVIVTFTGSETELASSASPP